MRRLALCSTLLLAFACADGEGANPPDGVLHSEELLPPGVCDWGLAPPPPPCGSDAACGQGQLCMGGACVDANLAPNPTTCPEAPAAEELVCSNWDPQECPCYAGYVAFHEKDEGGRRSCAGVVDIFSERVRIKQVGCHLEALGGELSGDAVGFGAMNLRIAQLPYDTRCEALTDRWHEPGWLTDSPAVRIECSPTCSIWMEQFLAPTPERIVPDGSFDMGTPDELPGDADERPEHLVDVTCFYADRFEVSRADYLECLNRSACAAPDYEAAGEEAAAFFAPSQLGLPITWVNAAQAEQYCRFRDKVLPTEAEWERTARGGRAAMTHYPWGDASPFLADGAPDCERANFSGCAGAPLPTTNGGSAPRDDDDIGPCGKPEGASFFGVVDLGGNVREWTRDYYRADAYLARAASAGLRGAKNPEQEQPFAGRRERVVRGGSFLSPIDPAVTPPIDALRASNRDFLDEARTASDLGFRCVRYKPGVAR